MSDLVSTEWLAEHLNDVTVVDASWYMPGDKRDPKVEYEAGHIPGAVFFDLDAIADHDTDLPHMLPTPDAFAHAVARLGIGSDKPIVVYDGSGIFSAPRVWWTFKVMGHDAVSVLDGGLPKWKRETRALESGMPMPAPAQFVPHFRPAMVRGFGDVMGVVESGSAKLVDARSPARFLGQEAEPRAGVRGGHMPGAANVHFRSLLTADGTFRSPGELRAAFDKAGVALDRPIVTTCGTGVTAAILALALGQIGAHDVALYDGSWTEWGARPEAPVTTA